MHDLAIAMARLLPALSAAGVVTVAAAAIRIGFRRGKAALEP